MGLLITFILGIFILVGALLAKLPKNSKLIEQISISVALGTMISLVTFELIPEVFETFKSDNILKTIFIILIFILLGIVILKILDIFIPEHDHEHGLSHNCTQDNLIHIGVVSSIAIILHNIIEGMAVYSMSESSFKLGVLVSLGVGLHNIPMGMILYSTLKKDNNKKRIILLSLASLSTFIGGLLMMLISSLLSEVVIGVLILITLGMLIYIIIFELIPHLLHCKNKILSIIGVVIGFLILIISTIIE
ncbi:MAG: ZIP family metal transporter [Bacilli bacterium]|nr:ZIP family metal transporter [Bacilli bacterium]